MNIKTPEQIARYAFSGADSNSLTVAIAKRITQEAIEADRAQRAEPVVVIRNGEVFWGQDVEVIDLDFLNPYAVTRQSDFDQDDIDRMTATLESAGFTSAAADVREWWAER